MRIVSNTNKSLTEVLSEIDGLSDAADKKRQQDPSFPTIYGPSKRLENYTDEIARDVEEASQGIGGLYSDQIIANVWEETQDQKAKIIGTEEELKEEKRRNLLEQEALQPPTYLGKLPLIDYYIQPYIEDGKIKRDSDGSPFYIIKFTYGYKFFQKKPGYKMNMYNLLSSIYSRAKYQRFHLGNFERDSIISRNAMIYDDDLRIYGLSNINNKGLYRGIRENEYKSFYGVDSMPKYPLFKRILIGIGAAIKSLFLGPRVIVLGGPMKREKIQALVSVLSEQGAAERLKAEENA